MVNHYFFRTYAFDLGLNNNAIYDYAHFRWNDCMLMQPQFQNILSDHFSLYPIFVSPLMWILGSYTMLVFQIAAIIFGGFGILKFLQLKFGKASWIPLAGVIHFFSFYGIYSALAFDYHDNVVAAMFVPWLFYFFEKKNYPLFYLFLFLILIGKENMALWSFFIGIGLLFLNISDRQKMKHAAAASIISVIYFILVISVIIPALANENREYLHYNYDVLGDNFSKALPFIFKHPQKTFSLLFENHTHDWQGDFVKSETYYLLLLSGGFACILRPQYLLMLLPIFGQKMFSNDVEKWGIGSHYSIEFAPLVTISLFSWIYTLDIKTKYKSLITIVLTALVVSATISALDRRISPNYKIPNSKFYDARHWKSKFDVSELNRTLKLIPDNAKVSAQSSLVPHLAFRQWIYLFPHVADADYIALLNIGDYYPVDDDAYFAKINQLKDSNQWNLIYDKNSTLIFKRR
jgi:uncharacterized membrane protein